MLYKEFMERSSISRLKLTYLLQIRWTPKFKIFQEGMKSSTKIESALKPCRARVICLINFLIRTEKPSEQVRGFSYRIIYYSAIAGIITI